nr:rhodanese-like domain-containing protein [uncultured Desulfobacter sp.]
MRHLIRMLFPVLVFILVVPGICLPGTPAQGESSSLLIPATTLMQKTRQNPVVFMVDTRLKTEFKRFKIPGSLNIPASLIKTKAFLKTKPVVLIHTGVAHTELLCLAKDLNAKGFDACVLEGGIAAWIQKGGAMVGNPFSIRQVNEISPGTLFAGQANENWLILDFSAQPPQPHPIPKAITIKTAGPDGNNQDMVGTVLNAHPLNQPGAIIILNETGQDYNILKQRFPAQLRHKIFTLTGGMDAYNQFLSRHRLAVTPKSQRTKTTGECEPCSKKNIQ